MPHLPVWLTRVESSSMVPSLRDGDLVWTVRPGRTRPLARGAVVAVDSRELRRRIVKRIVGLPGEHLTIDGRAVVADGRLLDEPYATGSSAYRGAFHVPDGHYLLLGDDRDASSDARSWLHPYVARAEVVGRLLTRLPATAEPRQRARKRWSDLSTGGRVGLIAMLFAELAVTTVALSDLAQRPATQVRGSKLAWGLGCFVQPVGPLTYLRFGRRADVTS